MGKIRVKTLGDDTLEKKQKKEVKKRQEAKKVAKTVDETENKITDVKPVVSASTDKPKTPIQSSKTDKQTSENRQQKTDNRNSRSKKYTSVAILVDKTKTYTLSEALEKLPKLSIGKFDETVELHINTTEPGLLTTVTLPHGTGKKIRVAIANDELIGSIEKGKIEFDILLAKPEMMPKLAKVAKVLGPRGLMPNPKNGTVSQNIEEAAKQFEGGQITIKTEAKLPVMHVSVGKVSFGNKKLSENIKTLLYAVQTKNIKTVTLKSTMSPGLKIQVA